MAARAYELVAEAERELDEAVGALEAERPRLGLRFLDAFEQAVATIMRYPVIGRKARRRLRIFVLAAWPYSIVYTVERDTIVVWAIAHHKRKPGYWRRRTPP